MKRRMDLGLEAAAETICCGIVVGLRKAKGAWHEMLSRAADRALQRK